jgi:hypothetical protein
LIAYEFDEPLAALMSSSAKHSAMDLTLRKADSRVYKFLVCRALLCFIYILTPMVRRAIDWFTLRRGDTSTAWRLTVPCDPILVESSRGPVFTTASTKTCLEFSLVHESRWEGAHLDGILVGQKMNDLEGMCDNSDSHEFLAVVASLHHQAKRCESRSVSLRHG